MPRYQLGNRVRVDDRRFPEFWANGATGTVVEPPPVIRSFAGGWEGHVRLVPNAGGTQASYAYWVKLDEPRRDSDGDGPYADAELPELALWPLEGSRPR